LNRTRELAAFALALFFATGICSAQQAGPKTAARAPGLSAELLQQWNEIGRKLIAMADDFPEDKYDYRPTPSVRTFAEQLLHTTGDTYLFTNAALGEKDPGPEAESRERFKTKAEVVAYLKKAFADGAAVIKSKGDKGMRESVKNFEGGGQIELLGLGYSRVEHSAEHYGQLVLYYRMAGLVPPESRPRK